MDGTNGTNGTGRPAVGPVEKRPTRPRRPGDQAALYAAYCESARRLFDRGALPLGTRTLRLNVREILDAAERDPSTAGPRLREALTLWGRRPQVRLWDDDGRPIQEGHNVALTHWIMLERAIRDDEAEAERQRAAAAVPVVNVTLPPDVLAPVAGQLAGPLAELVAVAARQEANVARLVEGQTRLADSAGRLADQLAPKQDKIVGSRYVADRTGLTTTRVVEMARTGYMPPSCIVPGSGMGKPWLFYKDRIDDWIAKGRPDARGKGKRG